MKVENLEDISPATMKKASSRLRVNPSRIEAKKVGAVRIEPQKKEVIGEEAADLFDDPQPIGSVEMAAPRRANSRLAAPETIRKTKGNERSKTAAKWSEKDKKIVFWQGIGFLGGAIALGLLFVMVILPALISVTAKIKLAGDPIPVTEIIPQAPVLNEPAQYSQSDIIEITGFGEPGTTAQILINGQRRERNAAEVAADGTFKITITLDEGENTISALTIYNKDLESTAGKVYDITVDRQAPELAVTNLTDGQQIVGKANQPTTLEGLTDPNIKIYVNDRLTRSNAEGKFYINITLTEGENTFTIRAVDQAENETEQIIKVNFTP